MSSFHVEQHKFVVKAGMTVENVKNAKNATTLQKKYASAFDTDGQKGFSQKEADLFNATTFSEKSDGSVIFWTRKKDGTKKGTKFNSKDNIQFKSNDKVKPYIKQVKVNKNTPKKEENVGFFDERWSGYQIAKLTGNNALTDWLQNKDKVCSDGEDDGKLSIGQITLNLTKGIIGGIPKAIINHPVATTVTAVVGGTIIAAVGASVLPVIGTVGLIAGIYTIGKGIYNSVTAKTDKEAKLALENLGMGITSTALTVASTGQILDNAAKAGVESAKVAKDASSLTKTVQMIKAIPEALKLSCKNFKYYYLTPASTNQYLLDFNNLDKDKTYVGLQYGTDNVAKQIQRFSGEYCPGAEAPTHTICLTNENGEWIVYQSSGRPNELLGTPSGTYKISASKWADVVRKKFELYDMNVDTKILEQNLGQQYGSRDIVQLMKVSILNKNGTQSDCPGVTCSEYISLGFDKICQFFKLPAWCITPAHYKSYVMQQNISPTFSNITAN